MSIDPFRREGPGSRKRSAPAAARSPNIHTYIFVPHMMVVVVRYGRRKVSRRPFRSSIRQPDLTYMIMITIMMLMIDWIASKREVVPCQSIKVGSGQVDMCSQSLGELYAIRKAAEDAVHVSRPDLCYSYTHIHTYIHTFIPTYIHVVG